VSTEKGNFNAEIGNDVIEAALRSVEKRTSHEPPPNQVVEAVEPASEVPQVAAVEEEIEVPIESAPAEADVAEEAAAAPAPTPEQEELERLKAQLEFSQAKGREGLEKLREEHEKLLRAVADLDNFKKRAAKEKEEVQKFGVERLLKDFLPVADNLDRAIEHAAAGSETDGLLEGVRMVRKLLEDTLGKHGVKGFSAVGQPFDPRLHEAIQQQETAEVPEHTVVAELVRGYTLNDRLVRPALVVVAKPPSAPPAEEPASESDA
jgi:molecular chaperone GrpE